MILPNGSEIGEKLTFISELNFPLIEKWGPRESGVRAAAEAGPETTTFDCVGEGTRSTNSATKRNCQNNQTGCLCVRAISYQTEEEEPKAILATKTRKVQNSTLPLRLGCKVWKTRERKKREEKRKILHDDDVDDGVEKIIFLHGSFSRKIREDYSGDLVVEIWTFGSCDFSCKFFYIRITERLPKGHLENVRKNNTVNKGHYANRITLTARAIID